MGEEKEKRVDTLDQKKMPEDTDADAQKDLPYCTTAPSAEHHRADSEDEPCDDGTGGKT